MKTLNFIGLDPTKVTKTVGSLQQLLADMQVFYTNLRNLHWNIQSDQFFTLHAKYEEMYNDANEKVDEIAERILTLGGVPQSKFSEYLKISKVKEAEMTHCPVEGIKLTLDELKIIIALERQVIEIANDSNDEVTADMMTNYLAGQEKNVWMLVAYVDAKSK